MLKKRPSSWEAHISIPRCSMYGAFYPTKLGVLLGAGYVGQYSMSAKIHTVITYCMYFRRHV